MEHTQRDRSGHRILRKTSVLILLLMEHTQRASFRGYEGQQILLVLILLLMEHTQREKRDMMHFIDVLGLNPSFNGTYSTRS